MKGRRLDLAIRLCFPLLALHTGLALATPLNYREAIDGDLPGSVAPVLLPILPLGVGNNTISGATNNVTETGFDFDSFAFTVPGGAQVIAGRIEMTDRSGNVVTSSWLLRAGSAEWNVGKFVGDYIVPSPGELALAAPLGSGVYNMTHMAHRILGGHATANYIFTFNVVPEPTTATLLVSCFALASGSRRRRHR
jgi:hypothetical protein